MCPHDGEEHARSPGADEEEPQRLRRLNLNAAPATFGAIEYWRQQHPGSNKTEALRHLVAIADIIQRAEADGAAVCICADGDIANRTVVRFTR